MDIKLLLANNINKLLEVKGYTQNNLYHQAKSKGHSIHRTTIKNIVTAEKLFRGETIIALCDALEVEPWVLFWQHGLDETGKPIGINSSVDQSICDWAVIKVINMLDELELDDSNFKSLAISKVIAIASDQGKDRAEIEFIKMIKDYSPK